MPDGTRLEARQAARAGLRRDDPGRGRGRDRDRPRTGRWCSTTRSRPGTPLIDVLPIATDVLELEITPNRPDCLGDLRRRARGARRHRRAAGAAAVAGRSRPTRASVAGRRDRGRRSPTCARASPRGCSRTSTIGPSPRVAEGAADGRRPAADQQRRRHHQLRDAPDRPAAARVRRRPRRGRAAGRPARRATASRSSRSTTSRARSTTSMLVIDDAAGPTSIAGVMGGNRSEVARRARRAC